MSVNSVLTGDWRKPDTTLRCETLYVDGDIDCNAIHARSIVPDPTNDLVCNKLTSNTIENSGTITTDILSSTTIDNSGTITTDILSSTTIANSGTITTDILSVTETLTKVPQPILVTPSEGINITNAGNYNGFFCVLTTTNPLVYNEQIYFNLFLLNYFEDRIRYRVTITNLGSSGQVQPIVISLQTAFVNGTDTQLFIMMTNASQTTTSSGDFNGTISLLIEKVFLDYV